MKSLKLQWMRSTIFKKSNKILIINVLEDVPKLFTTITTVLII